MKKLIDIFNKPYPFYIPFSRSFKLLIVLGLIIPVFLIVFQPFGLGHWDYPYKQWVLLGMSVPIFLTLVFNFYVVTKFLPKFFDGDSWSVGKEIIWSLWNFFTIVLTTGFYWTLVPTGVISGLYWGEHMLNALLLAIVPGSICIYFNYSRALRRKLKKAQELNDKLQAKISYYEHGKLKLVPENSSEVVNLSTDALLLIQSYDNYAKIVFDTGESQLLRSSLKHLESQIDYPFIVRCHRSYIINLAKVKDVAGNARDFKVKLEHYEEWIPVSREAYRKIVALFDEYAPKSSTPVSFSFDRSRTPQ